MIVWTIFTVYAASLGQVSLAANNIVMQIVHVSFMPGLALSIAAGTLVGRELGADRPANAARCGWAAVGVCLAYMGAMGLLFVLLRGPLIGAFAASGSVAEIGRRIIIWAAVFQAFDAVGITGGGALRGAGDTRYPMFVSVVGAWLVFLPAIFLLGTTLGWGIDGAWLGATLFLALVGVLLFERFRRGRWKTMRVVDERGPLRPRRRDVRRMARSGRPDRGPQSGRCPRHSAQHAPFPHGVPGTAFDRAEARLAGLDLDEHDLVDALLVHAPEHDEVDRLADEPDLRRIPREAGQPGRELLGQLAGEHGP